MYLIRGKHNLELFKKLHTNTNLHGTIGNFDGLHKGHQSILSKIKDTAEKTNASSIVFFTEPHASEYFALSTNTYAEAPPRICPWRKKFELLKENGIDFAFFLKFNNSLRKMTPEIFISNILEPTGLSSLTVGDDFRFGANRAGDFELLKKWGVKNNVNVFNTDTYEYLNKRVSSTRIRKALLENNFALAKNLLGRPYTFSGKVVHGQHLGRTIGIPTANIWLPRQKLPISGVYAVRCSLDNQSIDGIANMGLRPTVGGSNPVLEVHLFNFDSNIYSKRLEVEFINKIREEKKFANLSVLKSQIQEDIKTAKIFLSKTI